MDLVTLLNIFVLSVWRGLFDDEQLEIEGIQRMSARQKEQEQVRREATEDLAEDLDEGEKGDIVGELMPSGTPKKKFQRNFSDLSVWSDENKEKKLYIVLIRSHSETMQLC